MSFVVYGGNGHLRLKAFDIKDEAYQFAREFERYCWDHDTPVPSSHIVEES